MAGRICWYFLLAFIGANLLSTSAYDLDQETCGGVCVVASRENGTVGIRRCKNKDKNKALILELAFIKQLAQNGSTVGKVVDSDLAKKIFTFSKKLTEMKYQGLYVMKLEVSASYQDLGASLSVAAYVACEAGNVTWGEETYNVEKGSLKLIFTMENYPFCEGNVTSLCKEGEVGKYVEFGVFVKNGKGKPPKKDTVGRIKRRMKCHSKRCPKNFIFGDEEDGDELVAASQCENDGVFLNMTGDYPKVLTAGNRQILAFRVPKFVSRTRFDPGVTIAEEGEDEEPSHATTIQLSVFSFVVMMTAVFTFM